MSFACSFLLSAALATPLAVIAQTQETAQPKVTGIENTAQLLGVLPELTRLQTLASSAAPPDRWQILWLHQHITEQVMAVSLQVDATIAQIDNEIARDNEIHSLLSDRRDRIVSRANLLSALIGGGLGAASSGLQLSSALARPASGVGIGAGTFSAGVALIGIHAQKGGTSSFDYQSNMLAEFFDRPTLPDSRYPTTIWSFLNQSAPSSQSDLTRKQQLLDTWVQVRRIDSLASADKIDRLTSQPSAALKLTIDDFEDRAAMLQDVRARISFLKRDLGILLSSLPHVDEVSAP